MTNIGLQEWESESALRSHLGRLEDRVLLVGASAPSPTRFYSCSLETGVGTTELGILSSNLGPKPTVLQLDRDAVALVGHDVWITWVNVAERTVLTDLLLGGAFYEFQPVDRRDEVLVLHELGALRIDARGREIWRIDTDVVEDFRVDVSGNLILSTMDRSSPMAVSTKSGARVHG
jgi:hypothetical protein